MHTQFNKTTRVELAALMRAKHTPAECAHVLGMHKSSVTREIKRYGGDDGVYRGASAQRQYLATRQKAKAFSRKIENDPTLQHHIKNRIGKRDSPEQIAGRIQVTRSHQSVSYETIYRWILTQAPELKTHLRRIGRKGKYRRKRGTAVRAQTREEAKIRRIETRPKVVEKRTRIGDFEGDTIIGKDKTTRLTSNVDRQSGYGLLDKLTLTRKHTMHAALARRFRRIPKRKRHTYTYDNGTELGKEDRDLEKKIGMKVYRANPYHSWERGTNESYNGLVRDFWPKGTDFATLTDKEIRAVERNLNHRPRKRLGYRTPHEVFVLGKRVKK